MDDVVATGFGLFIFAPAKLESLIQKVHQLCSFVPNPLVVINRAMPLRFLSMVIGVLVFLKTNRLLPTSHRTSKENTLKPLSLRRLSDRHHHLVLSHVALPVHDEPCQVKPAGGPWTLGETPKNEKPREEAFPPPRPQAKSHSLSRLSEERPEGRGAQQEIDELLRSGFGVFALGF